MSYKYADAVSKAHTKLRHQHNNCPCNICCPPEEQFSVDMKGTTCKMDCITKIEIYSCKTIFSTSEFSYMPFKF